MTSLYIYGGTNGLLQEADPIELFFLRFHRTVKSSLWSFQLKSVAYIFGLRDVPHPQPGEGEAALEPVGVFPGACEWEVPVRPPCDDQRIIEQEQTKHFNVLVHPEFWY